MAVATNQPDGTVLVPQSEAVAEAASTIEELQAHLTTAQTDNEVLEKENKKLKADLRKVQGELDALKANRS